MSESSSPNATWDEEALHRASFELQRHFGREGSIYGIKACEEIARIAIVAYGRSTVSAPSATVGEDEIKRFRVGDILFSDEQAKMFCELALKGLRAEAATYGEGVMRDMVTSLRFLVKERRHVQIGVVDHDLLAAAAAIEQLLAATIAPSATTSTNWNITKVDCTFSYLRDKGVHEPVAMITFGVNDWDSRDRFAASLKVKP